MTVCGASQKKRLLLNTSPLRDPGALMGPSLLLLTGREPSTAEYL